MPDAITIASLSILVNGAEVTQMPKLLGPEVKVVATKSIAIKAIAMAIKAIAMAIKAIAMAIKAIAMAIKAIAMAIKAIAMAIKAIAMAIKAIAMAIKAIAMAIKAIAMAIKAIAMAIKAIVMAMVRIMDGPMVLPCYGYTMNSRYIRLIFLMGINQVHLIIMSIGLMGLSQILSTKTALCIA